MLSLSVIAQRQSSVRLLQVGRSWLTTNSAAAATTEAVKAPTTTSKSKAPLEYYVRRTNSKLLPVYTDIRNGNTRHLTIIRRIDGSAQTLAKDITTAFPDMQVSVKSLNNQVIIKGRRTRDICQFLEEKGF
ncbi:mitochondrial large subunit ribosomal protein-domain-containing protein [Syncephalis fuscata]|nr:mitochondrial large subunit ribosomal protein-domain-containing protein [Syncephalis fuscata]